MSVGLETLIFDPRFQVSSTERWYEAFVGYQSDEKMMMVGDQVAFGHMTATATFLFPTFFWFSLGP